VRVALGVAVNVTVDVFMNVAVDNGVNVFAGLEGGKIFDGRLVNKIKKTTPIATSKIERMTTKPP